MTVKRYNLHVYHPDVCSEPEMHECSDGDYVLFADFDRELAEARKDADRYRWLRGANAFGIKPCIRVWDDARGEWRFIKGDEADRFIDAALGAQ